MTIETTYSLQGYIEIQTAKWRNLYTGLADRAAVEAAASAYRHDVEKKWMGIPGKKSAPLRVVEVTTVLMDWEV